VNQPRMVKRGEGNASSDEVGEVGEELCTQPIRSGRGGTWSPIFCCGLMDTWILHVGGREWALYCLFAFLCSWWC